MTTNDNTLANSLGQSPGVAYFEQVPIHGHLQLTIHTDLPSTNG